MTPRERAAEEIVEAILKCGMCPNIIPKNADCDYPECRDSLCEFWQRADAIKEQVGGVLTEHVRALLAEDEATIEAMERAYCWQKGCQLLLCNQCGKCSVHKELFKMRAALAVLRRKALG